ncbi:ROK family protein [Nonomuraea glycinis]|uniref:ROK family protein n=1 Tax=Nonomuraea glycinis TaxID=2047744 RepID=UPI0033BB40BC
MILAIDVGGTKMAAALVGPDGVPRRITRVATPQHADAQTLWKTLTDLIDPLCGGVAGVGVGCGGPMTWPAGEVSPLNIPAWRGFPLRARLAARFPGLPVRIHNDAVCVAVAEHWQGAGRGSADMLGMVVSTGVGGGLILGGRLINGGTGNAGHIGHVVVEPEGGPRCGCGGHGCLEAVARGPALTEWALSQGWTPSSTATLNRTLTETPDRETPDWGSTGREAAGLRGDGRAVAGPGIGDPCVAGPGIANLGAAGVGAAGSVAVGAVGVEPYREDRAVTGRALAADARAGVEVAVAAMRRAGRALGIAIASATHLCDLDLVTIGGGLSQAGEPLFGPLEEALREHARMDFARRVRVVPAALGQEAGLVGAAALILAGESY